MLNNEVWVSIKEFAKRMNISERTIWRNLNDFESRKESFKYGYRIVLKLSTIRNNEPCENNSVGSDKGMTGSDKVVPSDEETEVLMKNTGVEGSDKGLTKHDEGLTGYDKPISCIADTDISLAKNEVGGYDKGLTLEVESVPKKKEQSESMDISINQEAMINEMKELFKTPIPTEVLKKVKTSKTKNDEYEPTYADWDKARTEDKERAWAKFNIVKAYIKNRMEKHSRDFSYKQCDVSFINQLYSGTVCREDFKTLNYKNVSIDSIKKWELSLRESGDMDVPVSLIENYRFCGRKSKIEESTLNMIKQLAVDNRNLEPSWIYLFIKDQLEMFENELTISPRHMRRLVRGFRKDTFAVSQGKGKESIRNKVKLHVPRVNDLLPGELWESDGHKCNLLIKSPFYYHFNPSNRYLVRPTIIAWIDVGTGLIVGYRVCLTENKNAVRNSLMDAVGNYGIPVHARVDNSGSYLNVEYAPMEFWKENKGKKLYTATEKIARRMIENGDQGLFKNLGIDIHFTIPGNPESKSIEAFWNYCISPFEKTFKSWIGNKIENRPEKYKNMDNKTLARKYPDDFPTWDEFCERLDLYVQYYNNKQRRTLVTIEGTLLTPLEAYNGIEHTLPSKIKLQSQMRDPYIEVKVVQRSMIEKNGILYWHPIFPQLIGKKVGIYYDEKNLQELTICNERGQIYTEKAIAINPGLQSGDDLKAMIEVNQKNKIGKLCYLALSDITGAMKIEKMLGQASKELLPPSNSKQLEDDDIRYLNFDDALDEIAGIEEPIIEIVPSGMSDADKELREDIKKDIIGMFGE